MSLLIFCPAQPHKPLDQSPLWSQTQWIMKRWPPSKTVVQKRSACWVAHLSNWLSTRQALNAWLATFLLASSDPLSPKSSGKIFVHIVGSPPIILFHPGSCGVAFPVMSPPGLWVSGLPVGGARSITTHTWSPNPSPSLNRVFLTSIWIWWAHQSIVTVLIIFLPLLIAHPNGWKLFHLLKHPWQHELRL